ncbi:MAG: hypothetical protein HQL28_02100 [Candidatus Omnitrophica bacterium]|nr:hypothetical protein [Candidatus Omnitrophota bacterium]
MKYDHSKWYDDNYHKLIGGGIWLRGGEINTLPKEEYAKRPFRVLFTRLSTYRDTSASFTHELLYGIAADIPEIFPDIAYLPPPPDAKIFEKENIPWLLGTGTKYSARAFDFIGFSNSIVQEILNIPAFLRTSGIPLERKERLKIEDVPLVILGGANALYTYAVWGQESWIDGVFIGDDNDCIHDLLEICADGKKIGKTKSEILMSLAGIPGFYETSSMRPPVLRKSKLAAERKKQPGKISASRLVPYAPERMGAGMMEISRGCRAFCSFCAENWQKKPYSENRARFLTEKALELKAEGGLEEIDLFSFNFNMHSEFYTLMCGLSKIFKNVGFKSQRFDALAGDPAMIDFQLASGKNIFSCGLEGISKRLRKYLNKTLNEKALFDSFELILKKKVRELKIFVLSTGLENDGDFSEFEKLQSFLFGKKKEYDSPTRIVFSVTPLVKFPATPLEFGVVLSPEILDGINARMKKLSERYTFEFREAASGKEFFVSETLLRADGPEVMKAILAALGETGFTYYRGITEEFYSGLLKNLARYKVDMASLFGELTFDGASAKPWASINTGTDRKLLWDIYLKNMKFEEVAFDAQKIGKQVPPCSLEEYKQLIINIRQNESKKAFNVEAGESLRGLPRKYLGIALARAIMKTDNNLTSYFRYYSSSLWSAGEEGPLWFTGSDVIYMVWDKKAEPLFAAIYGNTVLFNKVNEQLAGWGILCKEEDPAGREFSVKMDSPYKLNTARGYFKKNSIKYTLHKTFEDERRTDYSFELSKDSLKKNNIKKMIYTIVKEGGAVNKEKFGTRARIEIVPGVKFNITEFMRDAFDCPGANDWIRIKAVAKFL